MTIHLRIDVPLAVGSFRFGRTPFGVSQDSALSGCYKTAGSAGVIFFLCEKWQNVNGSFVQVLRN